MNTARHSLPSAPDVPTRRCMELAFKECSGVDDDACQTVAWAIRAGFMVFERGRVRLTKEGFDYEAAEREAA